MLFNSYVFVLAFLPCTLLAFYTVRPFSNTLSKLVLLSASLVFYAYWNVAYLPLLVGSILVNYAVALVMVRRRNPWLFGAAVAANLGVLGYFKYMNFFVGLGGSGTGLDVVVGGGILPLGISFFTFQQIAYLVNRWRDTSHGAGRFEDYAVYVSFFPQLIAGPIVRDTEFMPQIAHRIRFDPRLLAVGLLLFSIGLFKKVVVADSFATVAAPLFAAAAADVALSTVQAWLAALSYTFQLYFDFSAYSDMAIGLGALFGIVLPVNFFAPYRSLSPIDFWRRWHITLSRFFRDYLYIPLGGSRGGSLRQSANLAVVMVLCGLWHGAGWTFIAWGALHGLALIVCHTAKRHGLALTLSGPASKTAAWAATFVFVIFGWVIFRASTVGTATDIWAAMLGFGAGAPADAVIQAPMGEWTMIALGLAWVLLLPTPYRWFFGTRIERPVLDTSWIRLDRASAAACGVAFAAAFLALSRTSEFLYYNF